MKILQTIDSSLRSQLRFERSLVEGSQPSGNSVSPAPTHQNPLIYNALQVFRCCSPRPYEGNVFLHIFPKQRMDVGSIPVAISNAVLS